MLLLPSPAYPAYNVITTIDGVDYELVYTYDEHRDLWRFGVNNESGDAVMGHRPLLPFVQMRPNAFASALEGVFALIAPLPTDDAYDALTGGLWSVVYGLPAEIAELADSLADLAGDADVPVVPINVIYPPNNAILSNPVVTFNGTGPANQLLFARGESIQVDSMGSWVWTHTFSESNPVVVFEGESGQRATVRFSIIMQPLTINPVGEDIDGTRYVFTEDVEITGAATPNSAIIVNGQPVSVGGDGTWSVVITLSAGQSHTITAQSANGQIAQTSVYVWGEPDILAYGPEVLLMRYTGQYTDSAMTIPAIEADPAGAWMDQSGNGNHFTQPVSAHRPIIQDGGVFTERTSTWLESLHTALTPFTAFIATGPASGVGTLYGGTSGDRGTAGTWVFSAQTNARRLHMPQGSNNYSEAADVNLEYSNPASIAGIAQPDREFWVEGLGVVGTTINKIVSDDWATNKPTQIQSRAGEISTRYFMFFSEILPYDDRQMILRWLEANND